MCKHRARFLLENKTEKEKVERLVCEFDAKKHSRGTKKRRVKSYRIVSLASHVFIAFSAHVIQSPADGGDLVFTVLVQIVTLLKELNER